MYPIVSLFGLSLGTYGICCVIGGALAIWLAIRNGKRFQQDRFAMLEACVWALIGGFLGAKLLYLLVSFSDIMEMFQTSGFNWNTISSLLEGGFVFYGGLLGGLAALLLYLHHFQLPYGVYLSSITPAIPLAHAFGRIGCFFAGCCYGIPYDPPIGICLKNAIGTAPTDIPLFPVQLLESGLNLLLAGLLQLCFRKRIRKPMSPRSIASAMQAFVFSRSDSAMIPNGAFILAWQRLNGSALPLPSAVCCCCSFHLSAEKGHRIPKFPSSQ